ncbi:stalk domain-containing protein [Paenibacillus sp. B01]|uniref:stalk domain-containing protein n=1 Tax=Paenibacillus sp. B01 TaxID=2660554 RepID=UPI00129B230E|nr:stalk domain-containing protein [Paenibacillus sp. B01]QGG55426.1 trypsin-like serine protease [Paenibacillus sp. B01]
MTSFKIRPVRCLSALAAPVLAVALLASGASPAAAQPAAVQAPAAKAAAISVTLDGKKLSLQAQPIQSKGTILVPMKDLFKALGATVTWEPTTRTVIASSGGYLTLTLQIGASHAAVNGKSVKLDAPATVRSGVTYVPIRFVSEAFGAAVRWDAAARVVRIQSEEAQFEERLQREEKAREARRLTTAQIVAKNDDSVVLIQTDYGQGSGVVVGDRYVLTNLHVMQDAKSGFVKTNDGRSLPIVGVAAYDEKVDLAIVLTKDELDLDPVTFGSFDDMQKGDPVVAIGSPLGVQNTVSVGVVSNFGYDGGSIYYQISAPIDHGSSGGGLFNQYGELIGLTTSGYEDTAADLNFAVASEDAVELIRTAAIDPAKVGFLKPTLPETLVGAPEGEIASLLAKQFDSVSASDGELKLKGWTAKRDADGWLQLSADIDTDFYDYYGSKMQKNLQIWAANTAHELHRMLPKDKIRLNLFYSKKVGFEPRDYEAGAVSALPDGKWQVRYSILDVQFQDELLIRLHP